MSRRVNAIPVELPLRKYVSIAESGAQPDGTQDPFSSNFLQEDVLNFPRHAGTADLLIARFAKEISRQEGATFRHEGRICNRWLVAVRRNF